MGEVEEKDHTGEEPLFKNMIKIEDDLDLRKIMRSGQCFRVREFDDDMFRFITKDHVLYIHRIPNSNTYEISCSLDEWNDVWSDYFDLGRDYSAIRSSNSGIDPFIDTAMEFSNGIRVLKQDPWEMLITFIISQRKNIPAISKSIELISQKFGTKIQTPVEEIFPFPTPDQLVAASEPDLKECSLGYRVPYVMDAVRRVGSGELDLESIADLGDVELFEELQKVCGVGKKVANCICLFAYSRHSLVPIDVWIARAIEEDMDGTDPFDAYGDNAGIIQQFVFYFMTNR